MVGGPYDCRGIMAKQYVDKITFKYPGKCIFKRYSDKHLNTSCPICSFFRVETNFTINDLVFNDFDATIMCRCDGCGIVVYIRRTRNSDDFKLWFYTGYREETSFRETQESSYDETPFRKTEHEAASADKLKEIYKQLILKYHPDKTLNPLSGEIFIKIQELYQKKDYDGLEKLL